MADFTDNFADSQANQSQQEARGYIFDIKKYAIHDGPGIRTTVFFKGCPLQCQWCHNPESWRASPEPGFRKGRCIRCGRCIEVCKEQAISLMEDGSVTDVNKCKLCGECIDACARSAREIIGQEMTVSQVMSEVKKDVIFYDQSDGGVTFSGGEPLMQPDFLLALLNQCQAQGIHTAVDTTCYAEPEVVQKIAEKTDLFLCDLKHMDGAIHRDFTSVDNDLMLYNIRHLSDVGKKIVIRIPVIPGFNDDLANIEMTAKFVALLENVGAIDILPFNRGGKGKSARLTTSFNLIETEVPNGDKMISIADTLKNYGFKVKIGG
ncbi:MAG: glycyl-radical enzyme activating protein [Planctomycetota bacterium]